MILENEEGESENILSDSLDNEAVIENDNSDNENDIGRHEEASAKARGWVPKDQFRGKETDWQDAKSFLDRNSALKSELEEVKRRQSEQEEIYAERIRRIESANERIIRDDRERTIREIRQAKRSAAELGDIEELDRLELIEDKHYQRFAEVDREQQEAPAQRRQQAEQAPDLLPETQDWIRRNTWFKENQNMQQIALGFYNESLEGMPATKDESKRLAYVEKKMSEVYPDKFGGGNRNNSVESGTRNIQSGNQNTKLTNDERAACRKFIAKGIIKNEAEYIRYLNDE